MNQNLRTLFFLKKGKGSGKELLPVYVRITINGKRAEWSVQRTCESEKWNQILGRMRGSKQETLQLNQYLETIQGNIFEIQKEYALKNIPLTSDIVKQKMLHKKEGKQHSLVEIYQYHNDQFAELVGTEYSPGTLKKFKSALTSLKNFLLWKFNRNDIFIAELNHQFVTDYEFYLKSKQGLQHNSAMNNIKKLKKIVKQCIANKWLDLDPFIQYKMRIRQTHRNFLLKDELETLISKKFVNQRLDQVKDIFLFSCYTGLSYSDVMKLTNNDLNIGIDGELWIFVHRTKTETDSRIPLLPIPKDLLSKYKDHPAISGTNHLLPQITNQRLNGYLKEITDICGFKKELTFHCSRHTFATTVTLSNGVPIETVGKMLGHINLRTTQQYARILDRKVSEDMQDLRKRLLTKNNQEIKIEELKSKISQ
jgi:site-specific recombinase XerD